MNDPNDPPTVLNTLEYSLLTPDEREEYQWDEDIGMYVPRPPDPGKFLWSPDDITLID